MAKHALLDACGLFDEEMPARQDYDMWVRLCQVTKVGVVKQSCVEYHNLAENNQISWDYRRFVAANTRLRKKYGALRAQRLGPAAERAVRAREALSVARKAFKAGHRDIVCVFARESLKIRFSAEAIVCLLAAYLPAGLVSPGVYVAVLEKMMGFLPRFQGYFLPAFGREENFSVHFGVLWYNEKVYGSKFPRKR